MSVYDINGNALQTAYDILSNTLSQAYSVDSTPLFDGEYIPAPTLEAYSSGYINDNGVLTPSNNNYVSDVYRQASGSVIVITAETEVPNINYIRIAEYDSTKTFIQRQYVMTTGFCEFTLDENTEFIRVGFQTVNTPNLNNIFTYYQTTNNPILCNQIGYDSDKSKRTTVIGNEGADFSVANASNRIVYTGTVSNGIADFSAVTDSGTYYVYCNGVRSWTFTINANRLWSVMAKPALDFMAQSRQDAFDVGGNTGYAWRDGHQFSFELNGLVMQYMSNPTYYNSLPYGIYKVNECEYTELRTQDCPDIIWLMKFAVTRYYDWNVNDDIQLHALIKAQVAYFLFIYPHISQYVSATWYRTIRDWIIGQWSVTTCNKSWYEVSDGINHNLFATQEKIGTVKGMLPPGYAIVPNFMMYEVCTRDGLSSASQFMTAAENNIAWLVNSVDLSNPANTKGQRMSEHITFHALTYAYEMYPSHCPSGTYAKIASVANLLISRSNNLWDYTQYQTDGDLSGATTTVWNNTQSQTSGLANNPGYVGMMGVYFALARVITDTSVKAKLKELAMSHIDHGFGRNPLSRCFDYKATDDFDGAKLGWVSRLSGGYGHLDNVVAVLDGSPKEGSFPFNPSASTGYTEGWVAFNSAWNMALAYLKGEDQNGIGIFASNS